MNPAIYRLSQTSQPLNALQQIEPVEKGIIAKALSTKTNEVSKAPKRDNLEKLPYRIVRIWMTLNEPASIRAGEPALNFRDNGVCPVLSFIRI